MSVQTIVGEGLLLTGLAGLVGCASLQEVKNVDQSRSPVSQSASVEVKEVNDKEYRVFLRDPAPRFLPFSGIWSSPEGHTGVSAQVVAWPRDEGKNAGIVKLLLYEDGREIFSTERDFFSVPINHAESGTHTYRAQAIDRGGNKAMSEIISIDFSGKPIDTPPKWLSLFVNKDGRLHISVIDIGDNKGLREVLLYEDGLSIRVFECDKLSKLYCGDSKDNFLSIIPLEDINQNGKHTYFAEATDIGGNKSKSETITINYE